MKLIKLLKEKGFDLPMEQNGRVYCEGTGEIESIISSSQISNWNDKNYIEICSAPTIAEVVMWLYERHGIWIIVNIAIDDNWYFELYNLKDKRNAEILINDEEITEFHNSPTEAYQEAISYTLKNLI